MASATVTGSFKTADGVDASGNVILRPIDVPSADNSDIRIAKDITIALDTNGDFSQLLLAGQYLCIPPNDTPQFPFTVPGDSGTHSIHNLAKGLKAAPDFVAPTGSGNMSGENNLSELTNPAAARQNIGLAVANDEAALIAIGIGAKHRMAFVGSSAGAGLQVYSWKPAGTDAHAPPTVLRPVDYNEADPNNGVWILNLFG